jgi:hypothetical protein
VRSRSGRSPGSISADQEAAEGGHARQALPFSEADHHGLGLAVPGDDRRLTLRRVVDHGEELGLGVAQFSHA